MSEIVRPTRDGVYGREYISTCVDIGRKPTRVDFGGIDQAPSTVEVRVPIIFDALPTGDMGVWGAVGMASEKLGTLFVSRDQTRGDSDSVWMVPVADENSFHERMGKKRATLEYNAESWTLIGNLRT